MNNILNANTRLTNLPVKNTSVGIICSTGLGDTFLQMVIANNLARNGYQVTFFSDIAHSISHFISGYSAQTLPRYDAAIKAFTGVSVMLYDCASQYLVQAPTAVVDWFKLNGVGYQMSSGRPDYFIQPQHFMANLPDNADSTAKNLLHFNATIRSPGIGIARPPLAQQIAWFLQHRIQLHDVTADCGLLLNQQNVNAKKVLIHPSSSKLKKNWPPENYIALAKRLSSIGYQPIITVAPHERMQWQTLANEQIAVPLFKSISELAWFYQDASCLLGNDSGNAHLASAMGIPTLQIFGRWRNSPSWRAGWSKNKVITANFPYNLSKHHWQSGLSVDRVYREFMAWVDALPSDKAHQR